jgi:hypothetical protein
VRCPAQESERCPPGVGEVVPSGGAGWWWWWLWGGEVTPAWPGSCSLSLSLRARVAVCVWCGYGCLAPCPIVPGSLAAAAAPGWFSKQPLFGWSFLPSWLQTAEPSLFALAWKGVWVGCLKSQTRSQSQDLVVATWSDFGSLFPFWLLLILTSVPIFLFLTLPHQCPPHIASCHLQY